MKKILLKFYPTVAIGLLLFAACDNQESEGRIIDRISRSTPNFVVKTESDFRKLLLKKEGVLAKLSQKTLLEFQESLEFNERGLSTFKYSDVRAELSPVEFAELMKLFDLNTAPPATDKTQDGRSDDFLVDYKCESPGTCTVQSRKNQQFLVHAFFIAAVQVPGLSHL